MGVPAVGFGFAKVVNGKSFPGNDETPPVRGLWAHFSCQLPIVPQQADTYHMLWSRRVLLENAVRQFVAQDGREMLEVGGRPFMPAVLAHTS